ncbi:hypothetical protein JCM11641_000880 [Rhodosporidiobolus odoratus]
MPLRVLITNDDGTPTPETGHSPFVYPFAKGLIDELGAEVRVVVPGSQKSWVGKAYLIGQEVTGQYYYPAGADGTKGETRSLPKTPAERKEGDMEMVLLDGTPATCANIALHNLFKADAFDVVISGPNFGRNTSTAFALSSGTLGAALSASLSGAKAIAVSFGLMEGYKPPPKEVVDAAIKLAAQVVQRLVAEGWKDGEEKVDVYSINVPLLPEIVTSPKVRWTTMAQSGYGALFRSTSFNTSPPSGQAQDGGPAAVPEPVGEGESGGKVEPKEDEQLMVKEEHYEQELRFNFAPDLSALVNPNMADLVEGTDIHALHHAYMSVTPVKAAFAEAGKAAGGIEANGNGDWKL